MEREGEGEGRRREEGRERGEGGETSWQLFRAQSWSGNASLPLIAWRPDEFLEETTAEMLHKSHCCACVGCILSEVKGHRLWYIKRKIYINFSAVEEGLCCFFILAFSKLKPVWQAEECNQQQGAALGKAPMRGTAAAPAAPSCPCPFMLPCLPLLMGAALPRSSPGPKYRGRWTQNWSKVTSRWAGCAGSTPCGAHR